MDQLVYDEEPKDEIVFDENDLVYDESKFTTDDNDINGIFNIDDVIYLIKDNKIYPEEDMISEEFNKFIDLNDVIVVGVSPVYSLLNSNMNISYIFYCKSSFYFTYEKQNGISELQDFYKDFGFRIGGSLEYSLSCDQYNSFLSQLKLKNEITSNLKNKILNTLKCKF